MIRGTLVHARPLNLRQGEEACNSAWPFCGGFCKTRCHIEALPGHIRHGRGGTPLPWTRAWRPAGHGERSRPGGKRRQAVS